MSVEATKSEAPSFFCSWGKEIGSWTCRRWCWWIKGVRTSQFTIVIQWDRPQQEHRAQDRKSPQLSAHPTFWGCEGLWRWFGGQLRWFIIIWDKKSRVWPKKGKNFVLQRGMMGELYKPGIMKNKSKNIELQDADYAHQTCHLWPLLHWGKCRNTSKVSNREISLKNSLNVFPFSANNIFP